MNPKPRILVDDNLRGDLWCPFDQKDIHESSVAWANGVVRSSPGIRFAAGSAFNVLPTPTSRLLNLQVEGVNH
jgi:hypothetical protein